MIRFVLNVIALVVATAIFAFWAFVLYLLWVVLLMPRAGAAEPPQVIARPYIAPRLQFIVESGHPAIGDVLRCSEARVTHDYADHSDSYVLLDCNDGIKLRLNAVQFDDSKVAIKVEAIR